MKEIANATTGQLSVIDGLAMQARALRLSINVNMWQLARVFIEAKELVPHGEWGGWLKENADVSERTAQDMMAAYRRFGGKAPFEGLSPTQTFKLLPLPEGSEERFMEEHDVQNMSTREIQEAVKKVREEAKAEIDRAKEETLAWANQKIELARTEAQNERQARLDAEQRAMDAENRPPEIPKELTEELARSRETIARQKEEVERLAYAGRESLEETRRLTGENAGLRRELQEQENMLQEQQEALNQAQEELLNLQSAQARGEEHHYTDDLTLDVFESAVREFIGVCARMPHMGATFSTMDNTTLNRYFQLVKTVESWADGARNAIATVNVGGGIIVD